MGINFYFCFRLSSLDFNFINQPPIFLFYFNFSYLTCKLSQGNIHCLIDRNRCAFFFRLLSLLLLLHRFLFRGLLRLCFLCGRLLSICRFFLLFFFGFGFLLIFLFIFLFFLILAFFFLLISHLSLFIFAF